MKKLFIALCALFTFTIAANACRVLAFCEVYNSIEADYYSTNSLIYVDQKSYAVQENPYANSQSCAPDMNWARCYKYMFTCNGKTYFFNPCE